MFLFKYSIDIWNIYTIKLSQSLNFLPLLFIAAIELYSQIQKLF